MLNILDCDRPEKILFINAIYLYRSEKNAIAIGKFMQNLKFYSSLRVLAGFSLVALEVCKKMMISSRANTRIIGRR